MKKIYIALAGLTLITASVFALAPQQTARYFNGPTVSAVTATTANVSLSPSILADLQEGEKGSIYFEYYETQKVCIAIYPTPAECLPKKSEVGTTSVTLTDLKHATSYTVRFKKDNTIRCITTPCPSNDFESLAVEFTTKGSTASGGGDSPRVAKNLWLGSRGTQVVALQNVLIAQGYLSGEATGYFGKATFSAVKKFQRAHFISPTGYVGVLTRKALLESGSVSMTQDGEKFEGTITAYSTACFADGECSITVDGKKIVTTIGWSQATVGTVTGIPDFGSVEKKVGAHATVYAKKTADGYTLYGNSAYYIKIQ